MPGKPVTRGFGGRIYFYNDRSQAVPVDGELVVYGFDDTARHNGSLVKQEQIESFDSHQNNLHRTSRKVT